MTAAVTQACAVCSMPASNHCTGCKQVVYCGKDHQRKHWREHKQQCTPWKIAENEANGRYLVATRKILAGHVILEEDAVLLAPRTIEPSPICLGCCYPISIPRYRCRQCRAPLCDEKCEKKGWHELECGLLRKGSQGEFKDYHLVAPLRCMLMKASKPQQYAQFRQMVSNKDTKLAGMDSDRIKSMANEIINRYQPDNITLDEALDTICILDSNTHEVLTKVTCDSMLALYSKATMLNHSCMRNTRPAIDSNYKMRIVALVDIPLGAEITTSYLDTFQTTFQRRALLKRGKSFECACERCSDPTELGSFASAILCSACKEGWITTLDPLDMNSSWQCRGCHLYLTAETVIKMDNGLVSEMNTVNKSSIQSLEKFHEAYKKFLHPNHVFLLKLKQHLVEGYGRLPGFEFPLLTADHLERKITICEELLKGMENIEPGLSFVKGVISLELGHAICMMLQKNRKNMTNVDLMIKKAKMYSSFASKVLEYEDKSSPEGALVMMAEELKTTIDRM